MRDELHPPGADVAEQAAFWDARLRNPECSAEERRDFEAWRAHAPEHARAFEDLQDGLEALRAFSGRPGLRAMRDEALRYRPRRLTRWFAVAAMLLVAVGVWGALNGRVTLTPAESVLQAENAPPASAVREREFVTGAGESEVVRLEDGSAVTLNTQSRVLVRFSDQRRDITLLSGEALFAVAHDATRPFVVRAGNRDVIAVGTEFTVRLEGAQVKVVLVEGRVAIERRDETLLQALMPGGRRELQAGQQLIADSSGGGRISSAPVDEALLWRDGRIAFRDMPLTEAVAEMNRYSARPIVITDPTMASLKVNGVFRTGQMTTFVGAVEEYFPIDAREQPDGDILLVWREHRS